MLFRISLSYAAVGVGGRYRGSYQRVQTPEIRAKIREEMESRQELWDSMIYSTGWENVRIATTVNPEHKELEGRTIAEIAAERGMEATECGLDLFCETMVSSVLFLIFV